jgi:hypothetical protein
VQQVRAATNQFCIGRPAYNLKYSVTCGPQFYESMARESKMWRNLFLIVVISYSLTANAQNIQSALSNKDVLIMKNAGLSDEVIMEKVRDSKCNFDTVPQVLADLKAAGISDAVILEMIHCQSRRHIEGGPQSDEPSDALHSSDLKVYAVSFVKHPDRRWRYGWRSERYDDISDYLLSNLVKELGQEGLRGVELPAPAGVCCFVTIELLEVNTRRGFTKVGIDVTANITVANSGKQTIYFKEYQGESKTVADSQWWHIIHHAVDTVVRNMANDEQLKRVLETGKR